MVKLLRYGNTNTFFVSGTHRGILVDTDWAGTLPAFCSALKGCGIRIDDIGYVLATHYHPDHMGLISELTEHGIKLLLVDVQREYVHFSDEIFGREKRLAYRPVDEGQATVISCAESRAFLGSLGIGGEILHTPAHSEDSISLLLDEGIALVGDLPLYDTVDAYDENECLKKCWSNILEGKPRIVYYAHANERYFACEAER